jgi:archaellum component FlaC
VRDENGNIIGEKKIDKEAQRRAAAEEQQKQIDQMNADEEDIEVEFGDAFGESENEQKAKLDPKEEFNRKLAAIDQIQDETEKKAALAKLLQESAVTETRVF